MPPHAERAHPVEMETAAERAEKERLFIHINFSAHKRFFHYERERERDSV